MDVNIEQEGPQPRLVIQPDCSLCARYNVRIEDVAHRSRAGRRHSPGFSRCLRPILIASLVAILGLVPASQATGLGSDVQRPLESAPGNSIAMLAEVPLVSSVRLSMMG